MESFQHRINMCRVAFEEDEEEEQEGGDNNYSSRSRSRNILTRVSDAEYRSWLHACNAAVQGRNDDSENNNNETNVVDKQQQQQQQQQQKPQNKKSNAAVSVGTAALLSYLQQEEPNTDFFFCLGADAFVDLHNGKWKESQTVLERLQGRFVVFCRQEDTDEQQQQHAQCSSDDEISNSNTMGALRLQSLLQQEQQQQQQQRRNNNNQLPALGTPEKAVVLRIDDRENYSLVGGAIKNATSSLPAASETSSDNDLVSSSLVRNYCNSRRMNKIRNNSRLVLPSVLEYIETHGLYGIKK